MLFVGPDPLDAHVAAVASIGIDPPPEWTALHARLQDFLTAPSSIPQRLADAVINGTDDVAALCAMALAEAGALPPSHATVDATVKHPVLQRLRDIYQPHALANYQSVAADFDALATKFANAASVVDPEESAERLVHAPDKLRRSWSDAERYAHQITETMGALAAAASLAGTNTDRDETLIALTVDTDGIHRRRLWEAWETTTGRTTRWGALLALGATIRAAGLDHLEPYRKPRPMEVKQVPVGIGVKQVPWDPEDDEVLAVANS